MFNSGGVISSIKVTNLRSRVNAVGQLFVGILLFNPSLISFAADTPSTIDPTLVSKVVREQIRSVTVQRVQYGSPQVELRSTGGQSFLIAASRQGPIYAVKMSSGPVILQFHLSAGQLLAENFPRADLDENTRVGLYLVEVWRKYRSFIQRPALRRTEAGRFSIYLKAERERVRPAGAAKSAAGEFNPYRNVRDTGLLSVSNALDALEIGYPWEGKNPIEAKALRLAVAIADYNFDVRRELAGLQPFTAHSTCASFSP